MLLARQLKKLVSSPEKVKKETKISDQKFDNGFSDQGLDTFLTITLVMRSGKTGFKSGNFRSRFVWQP